MTEKVKQHWAAEERRRKKKKKNSPPLHRSIEWGQKPLGTKNAAEKKKKKKNRTNPIAQVYDDASSKHRR
jgi:hypothetical protein